MNEHTTLDELLQQALASLESGASLDEVLSALPPEAARLAPAIRLAAQARALSMPQMNPVAFQYQQQQIMNAAQQRSEAAPARRQGLFARSRLVFTAGGALLIILFICSALSLLGGATYLFGPPGANAAELTDVQGFVEVIPVSNAANGAFAAEGQRVRQGSTIRTYSEASATLVFFDGSRTVLAPDSQLTLTSLHGRWGGAMQARLDQSAGSTSHTVVPLKPGGFFQVNTPAGQAAVQGTIFDVSVLDSQRSFFTVTRGKVAVQNSGSEVLLTDGQATFVQSGLSPEKPGYQFSLQGVLQIKAEPLWRAANTSFLVDTQTRIIGNPQEGDSILVAGRILGDGQWVADLIEPAKQGKARLHLTGVVTDIKTDLWKISGNNLYTDADTQIKGDPQVGDAVRVQYVILDNGDWLARLIKHLDDPTEEESVVEELPKATATVEVLPLNESTLEPKNDTQRCVERGGEHPVAIKLADQHDVSLEEIMSWYCQGYGFGEIDLAYSLAEQSEQNASQIFDLRKSGESWGQIKQEQIERLTRTPKPSHTPLPSKTVKPGGNPQDNPGNGPPEKTDKPDRPTKTPKK